MQGAKSCPRSVYILLEEGGNLLKDAMEMNARNIQKMKA